MFDVLWYFLFLYYMPQIGICDHSRVMILTPGGALAGKDY